ncbi:MAG TPA: hypothetical protein VFT45_14420 [Longimicrobium sp.]|nr:hypothetical protein [Longimicrobium sp.]
MRFPVPTTRCAFLRSTDASRIYVWILYVGEGNPRHTVEVAAAVPDSLAARDSSLSALSPYLTADVARIGGEPLMKLGTVRTTARAWVEGDTSIVVRVTEWAAIHRVFASRPGTAGMHVCGEESIRRVRVRYEPGF